LDLKNDNFKQDFETQKISTEKAINNKVVELMKVYNFYFDHFLFNKMVVYIVHKSINLSHSLWNYKRDMSIYEQFYYHFVGWSNDQNKSYRSWWVQQLLCSWLKSFTVSKCCLKLSFLEIQILNCSNKVTWKDDQNKSYRSWWVVQLLYSWLFHSKSYALSICCFKFPYFWISKF